MTARDPKKFDRSGAHLAGLAMEFLETPLPFHFAVRATNDHRKDA